VLKEDGENELANILSISKFNFDPQWEFSGIVSNQRKLYSNLKIPCAFRSVVDSRLEELSILACKIYEENNSYYYCGIDTVGILAIDLEEIDYEQYKIIVEANSVFTSFMKYLINNNEISDTQKKYLFEACQNGNNGNMLSATVMLGCSAELLLIDLSNAFNEYLKVHGSENEQERFERDVIKTKIASTRLNELMKRIEVKSELFAKYGFDNIKLNFNFLDIIRKVRNDSGHPTGNYITKEQFEIMIGTYQGFLDKTIRAINELSKLKP